MDKRKKIIAIVVWLCVMATLFVLIMLTGSGGESESIKFAMRDAVLHEENKIAIFHLVVNPAVLSAFIVSGSLLLTAMLLRIFLIPRFQFVPGRTQLVIEQVVSYFSNLAKTNSPHRNGFLGAYIFAAGVYIFVGTIFELFGIQAMTTSGHIMSLPAPLSDINAAITIGCLSYLIIMSGGIAGNGAKGILLTLKDFSLPISMSFRIFGALLSGLLVTELVYHYTQLSILLPVVVAVLFTLLHALIQTYVLTMLTALFYGEVSEPHARNNEKSLQK